jgi:hypothetical protein
MRERKRKDKETGNPEQEKPSGALYTQQQNTLGRVLE